MLCKYIVSHTHTLKHTHTHTHIEANEHTHTHTCVTNEEPHCPVATFELSKKLICIVCNPDESH